MSLDGIALAPTPIRRWSDDDRAKIREMRDGGASFAEIAREFDARESQVSAQYFVGTPPKLGPNLAYAPLEKVADKVVRPGIDKHLVPLCLYMGTRSFGRIHRWWNFSLAAMEQGAASLSDVVKLSHHPDFSHLCGPASKVPLLSAQGFFTRLRDNPKVTDNIPGMTEWAAEIMPHPWHFHRVPLETFERNAAAWRVYARKPRKPRATKVPEGPACYPYIAHDPKRTTGADLVMAVNKAVPRGLPEELRADICQDLICAVLAGEIAVENIGGSVKEFIAAGRKLFTNKWQFLSLDAPMPGMDGKTFMETI